MRKRNTLLVMLATPLALSSCTATPNIVKEFSSFYKEKEDDKIQEAIFDVAKREADIPKEKITETSKFFMASEEDTSRYLTAQRDFYRAWLDLEDSRNLPVYGPFFIGPTL